MSIPYAAFLRGINVGGHRKLPMAELRSAMESVGFSQVGTYIASGNVVFTSDQLDRASLTSSIEQLIFDNWGFDDVPVVLRTYVELAGAFAASPYLDSAVEPKHRFVGLLSTAPASDVLATIDGRALDPDQFTVDADHVHVLLPNGAAKSKLTNNYLEKHLGVVATLRNHNTIEKVIELLEKRS